MSASELGTKYGISEEQVKQMQTIFSQFDEDGDGAISKDEIESSMKALGHKTNEKMILQFIKALDKDKDGQIEFEEFLCAIAPKLKSGHIAFEAKAKKESLREAFESFDKNNDGYLTAQELKEAWDKMGDTLSLQEAKIMIAQADENCDGKVSYREFVKMWKDL